MSYIKFTKDLSILGLTNLAISIKTLIFLPVITKLLGAAGYGIWTQIAVSISLAVPMVTLGLPYALVRFLAPEKDKKQIQDGIYSTLATVSAVALLFSILFLLFSPLFSSIFGGKEILIALLACIIFFECLNDVLFNVFRAFQQNQKYSLFVISQNLGEISLVIMALLLGWGMIGAVFSLFIPRLIIFLIMSAETIKNFGIKAPQFLKTREYLRFSVPSISANLSSWMVQSSDKYLIGFFLGSAFVGYYSPAYVIGNSITFFIMPFIFVLPAILSKAYEENEIKKVKNYLKNSLKIFLALAIPSLFGLTALSKQILTICSTPEIAQKSYHIIPLVSFAILLFGLYSIIGQIMVLKKKTKIIGMIWGIAAFLNITFNLFLVPILGLLAAAIATIIGYAFAFAVAVFYSKSNFNFEFDWSFTLKSILSSLLMYFSVLLFSPAGLQKTIAAIIGGAAIYMMAMLFLKAIGKKEIKFMKNLFKF